MDIFFKSEGHKQRFLVAMKTQGKIYDGNKLDQEYGAACYILSADLSMWEDAQRFINQWGIDFDGLLGEFVSTGEAVLLKLAGNLFNGQQHIDPLEFMVLDPSNFIVALTAIQIRRMALLVSELEKGN